MRSPRRQRSAGPLRGRAALLSATGALCLCASIALVGCDAVTRYRILSFFFDGVPLPPGMAPDANTAPTGRGQARSTTQPGDANQPPRPKRIYIHKPYAERKCTQCHARAASFSVPTDRNSCRRCHPRYYDLPWDDWVHGPVAVSRCSFCHRAHESEYPRLLTKQQTDLCFHCHNRSETLAQPHHVEAEAGAKRCGACHDPHAAGNRLLLLDSTTYLRRTATARLLPTPHRQWGKDTCATCHLPGRSNELISFEKINQACLKCHEKVRQIPDPAKLHKPVREGKCIECHQAHESPVPHMIRPRAEKNCLSCHKLEEIRKETHPRIWRGECLLCHAGHTSPRKHLLKPPPEKTAATRPAEADQTRPGQDGARQTAPAGSEGPEP